MAIVIMAIIVIATLLALLALYEANSDAEYTLPPAHHTDRGSGKYRQHVAPR